MSLQELACAIIEQAVEDVRYVKRHGLIREGRVILDKRKAGGTNGGTRGVMDGRDAVLFLSDGRLDSLCDLINSKSVNADRIRAHVLAETFSTKRKHVGMRYKRPSNFKPKVQ